jgi:DNA-binding transcriptional regulator YdaS (Cro superfamily)
MTSKKNLQRAIIAAGGQAALGRKIGVKQQQVWYWLHHGRLPAERVASVVAAVNGIVQPHELRPDIFPHPRRTKAS